MIRAISTLEDVFSGSAKALYSQFRRLGVYQWRQVLRTAKHNPDGPLIALSFTHTELLGSPVSYAETQKVLRAHLGTGNTFPGPLRISDACFADLYAAAGTAQGGR
jgi:hypothetical protein